jgi:protein involved in polysaccharide export with SLBB domain
MDSSETHELGGTSVICVGTGRSSRGEQAPSGHVGFVILLALTTCLAGCGDQVRAPSADQLGAFEKAGAVESTVDMDRVRKAQLCTGPYRVVAGDVLEFTMPSLLQAITASELQDAQVRERSDRPHVCRVGAQGTIVLPAVGDLKVVGQSLAEIEEDVVNAYRRFVVLRPSVFVRVLEYRTSKVYVAGAVQKPGVYTLRSDQMTLVSLLTEGGGISEAGAAMIRVVRSEDRDASGEDRSLDDGDQAEPAASDSKRSTAAGARESAIVLPVVGLNTPFRDVALEEGDTVVVEQIQVPLFSVLGLVSRPGNFPYPPTAEYNLSQAIAFAGGLDPVADPRYVTIYRLGNNGSIVRVPLRLIEKNELTDALSTAIRPGDVVAVEHTPRTRMNTAIHNLLRINTGVYVTGNDLWDHNN